MVLLTCQKCNLTSYVPPNAQHHRCLRCGKVYSFDDTIHHKGAIEWCIDFATKKAEANLFCGGTRRRRQQTDISSHPPVSTKGQPPRGRRALLCGVSYKKQKHELKGVAQDVQNIKKLLLDDYQFREESILILAEEEPYYPPTRKNIEDAFQWLVRGIQPGDSLVFYFSGHGKRQREYDGDEIDGFNETICPMDFEVKGMILDNYITDVIVRPLIENVTLHAIIDSSHSGTILDLVHVYDITTGKWEDNCPPSRVYKGTNGGKAICFSACNDYQLAADTILLSQEKELTGAMTIAFINAVKESLARNERVTYKGIMDSIHQSIKQACTSGGFFAGIRRNFHRRIVQDPQLSSSSPFNISTEFKL